MDFELKLLDQYWIMGSRDPEGDPADTTSHGKIRLSVDGENIVNADADYGINQSAVSLLQTIFVDHIPDDRRWNPIFYHGCSIITTCPNCIVDFRVRHESDEFVILDQFYVTGGQSDADPMRYYDKCVRVRAPQYARAVVEFAKEAFAFLPKGKTGGQEYEVSAYHFLKERHEKLINLAEEYIQTGLITDNMKQYALDSKV